MTRLNPLHDVARGGTRDRRVCRWNARRLARQQKDARVGDAATRCLVNDNRPAHEMRRESVSGALCFAWRLPASVDPFPKNGAQQKSVLNSAKEA